MCPFRASRGESIFLLIQVVGRIEVLVAVGLKAPFLYWDGCCSF